jgi:hypothetical protein
MVLNRSNDLIWGAYGANAVHFSFLLEVVAGYLSLPVGTYTQVSMNTHVYERHWKMMEDLGQFAPDVTSGESLSDTDPYANGYVEPYPVMSDPLSFDQDCVLALEGATRGYGNSFFPDVFLPMVEAWRIYKENKDQPEKRIDLALKRLDQCKALDWQMAATEWLERRRTR